MRLLLIEDEEDVARMIAKGLRQESHAVDTASDGEAGLHKALSHPYDLIILDIRLPVKDGFTVCRELRQAGLETPLLMLTASGAYEDRVNGLDLGADDYLAKPFAMQELVARVGALGRRYAEKPAVTLEVADLSLDLANNELHRGSRLIELSARELTLLRVLMREPGRTFSRTELCERVWEREHEYDMKLVEVFISRLRKKIGDPPLIHTVRHLGYSIREAP